jgi:alpha-L-fucosidase
LIPYHNLAKIKYDVLARPFTPYEIPPKEHMQALKAAAAKYVKVFA